VPLPKPRDNEKRDKFLHRCMGDEMMLGDYAEEKQRFAVCNNIWEKKGTSMAEQLIPIFKTGTHTDSQGRTKEWGTADIDKIVASYDPTQHEAPIVIGHPKDNAPAFGWAEGLERKGEVLFAKAKQLVPEFVDMVKRGLFKKRSISLYPDGSLRHIGFLGAQPPAVKGLTDVAFAADEGGVTIEFSDEGIQRTVADTFRRIREWIIEKFDAETADRVVPTWAIESLIPPPPQAEAATAFSEADKQAQEARSEKYNIGVKEGGHVTKPSEWGEVDDAEFLDPVNYRYPCPNADQTRAAATYWGREKNQAQYSEAEQKIITARLEARKKKFKIGESPAAREISHSEEGGKKMNVKKKLLELIGKIPDEEIEPATFTEAVVKTQVEEAKKQAKAEGIAEGKKAISAEFSEKERALKKTEIAAYVDELIKGDGKKGRALVAAKKAGLVEFLARLDEAETIEFAEGGEKISMLAQAKAILETLPADITFSEVATKDKDTGGAGNAGEKLSKLAKDKQAKSKESGKEMTFRDALDSVQIEQPDLAKEYLAELQGKA